MSICSPVVRSYGLSLLYVRTEVKEKTSCLYVDLQKTGVMWYSILSALADLMALFRSKINEYDEQIDRYETIEEEAGEAAEAA